MKRVLATMGVVALLAAMLIAVGSTTAGAVQVCDGSGKGGVAGLEPGPKKRGDFDGDGLRDTAQLFYDAADDSVLVTRVKLANGYKTFHSHEGALGPIATFLAVNDVDKDGDDEILVNVFAQDPTAPAHLLTLADCRLVVAEDSEAPGIPATLLTGYGGPFNFGLTCSAPSQAGRGVTQFLSAWDYSDPQLLTLDTTRTEYRLNVDENDGTAVLLKKRERTQTLNVGTKRGSVLAEYAAGLHCGAPPKCDGKKATIWGTPFNDKINGTNGRDRIAALDGADTVAAKAKGDIVCAGGGNDTVNAGAGNDNLFGQRGNDTLNGQRGNDTADGGPGSDTCAVENPTNC